jgi:hypothetical protein
MATKMSLLNPPHGAPNRQKGLRVSDHWKNMIVQIIQVGSLEHVVFDRQGSLRTHVLVAGCSFRWLTGVETEGISSGPTHRVRACLNWSDRTSASPAPSQRCDAFRPTHPARPIAGSNLGQICVGPDNARVLPRSPRVLPPATQK